MEESKYLMHTYNRFNIEIESGEGCLVLRQEKGLVK